MCPETINKALLLQEGIWKFELSWTAVYFPIKNVLYVLILLNFITITLLAIAINWFITTNDNIDGLSSQLAMFELNTTKPQRQNSSSLENYMSALSSTVEDNADTLQQINEHLKIININITQTKHTLIRI